MTPKGHLPQTHVAFSAGSDDADAAASTRLCRAGDRFGLGPIQLSGTVLAALQQQRWPGNARELQHTIERLVALASGPTIGAEEMELAFGHSAEPVGPLSLKEQVNAFERALIVRVLRASNHNQSETARRLQVSRMTLVSKLKKYEIIE